jgi:hypothetical protein
LDTNYFVITHETGEGMIATQGRGHPRKEEVKRRIEFPDYMIQDIEDLRRDLRIDEGARIILITSLSMNEIVRLVSMHPEVWFMDVTSGVNKRLSVPHRVTHFLLT